MSTQNGRGSLPVTNPYTGEVDYEITPPTPAELAELCDSLRAAQVKWAAAPLERRKVENTMPAGAQWQAALPQTATPGPLLRRLGAIVLLAAGWLLLGSRLPAAMRVS